jgi:hypothetical protein
MYKSFTYLEEVYFPTYLSNYETYFLQNWLPRWNQILTQVEVHPQLKFKKKKKKSGSKNCQFPLFQITLNRAGKENRRLLKGVIWFCFLKFWELWFRIRIGFVYKNCNSYGLGDGWEVAVGHYSI